MRDALQKVGMRALEMIEENIAAGRSYDGTKYSYSTKPFARPVGKLPGRKKFQAEGRLKMFTTKQGHLWAVVTGGYKDWRAMNKLNPNGDYLQATGAMLRNLSVVEVDDEKVRLGFTDPTQRRKALWLEVTGAGRSRRLWKFLGLSDTQQQELAEYAATLLVGADLTKSLNLK